MVQPNSGVPNVGVLLDSRHLKLSTNHRQTWHRQQKTFNKDVKMTIPRTISWLTGLLYVLFMLYFSLRTGTLDTQSIQHLDKLVHAAAHFVLCSWFFHLLNRKQHLKVAAFSIFLGIAIEGLQTFVPYRQADIWDILANLAGTLLAIKLKR